jgi:hypothetical protein
VVVQVTISAGSELTVHGEVVTVEMPSTMRPATISPSP